MQARSVDLEPKTTAAATTSACRISTATMNTLAVRSLPRIAQSDARIAVNPACGDA